MSQEAIWAIALFLITYAFIVAEKIHRTIVAMAGGLLMVLFGIVDQETALHHISFNTLGLLTGMMIIVAITADTGLFKFIAVWAAKKSRGNPVKILVSLSLITAVGSAFLDNVTTVLLIVPVTFSITKQLNVSPIPFLVSEILMANIGGTATLIGDPPNIMIGSAVPELSFMDFIVNLSPVIFVIFIVTTALLILLYRKQIQTTKEAQKNIMDLDEKQEITDSALLVKCLIVLGLTVVGFFLHQILHLESATVALAGAFLLLLLAGESHLEKALERVEWPTIFFFIGLFALVAGLAETGVLKQVASLSMEWTGGNLTMMSMFVLWISAIASAFVDNIPFVATMIPMIKEMGTLGIENLEPLWWSLALGACLGGNGTLIGASANVIVAGLASNEGYKLSFIKYMLVGLPMMLLSIVIATVYVYFRYLI
ncbi:MAG TPA: ArsB/NhaD family transporter [Bacillales bacterium]|nr:ArsB/NhaD family transporter [Bacillales bacterium]